MELGPTDSNSPADLEIRTEGFFRRFLSHPDALRALRGLVMSAGRPHGGGLTDSEVLELVSHLARVGRLRVAASNRAAGRGWRAGTESGASGGAASASATPASSSTPAPEDAGAGGPAGAAPPPAPPPDTEKVWVRFKVVDEETKQPVAGVKLRIKLPSGEIQTAVTNAAGMIHLGGIDPGACDIVSMKDDAALEVTSVASN